MTSFFPQNMVPECKPEWNREAIMVFSRLPCLRRLQATPLLQTSLVESQMKAEAEEESRLESETKAKVTIQERENDGNENESTV